MRRKIFASKTGRQIRKMISPFVLRPFIGRVASLWVSSNFVKSDIGMTNEFMRTLCKKLQFLRRRKLMWVL